MVDAGLQAPAAPAPQAPQALQQPAEQAQNIPQLNWSHFKADFLGKPEEDAEAHLLRTNDWMDTPQFQEGVKVQRFLSHTSRRGKIMAWIPKTYKCRLARPTKSI